MPLRNFLAGRGRLVGVCSAVFATMIWAGNSVAGRGMAAEIPPMTFVAARTLVALAVLTPIAAGPLRREWPIIRRHLRFYALSAFAGMFLLNTMLYLAGRYVPATNLAIVAITSPLFVILISRFIYHESMGYRRLFGLLIILTGVLILLSRGRLSALLGLQFSAGDLFMLISAFSFAVYSLMVRKAPKGVSGVSFLMMFFIFSLLFSSLGAAVEFALGERIHFTPTLLAVVLYLGLGASLAAYAFWNLAVVRLGAAQASMFYYLLPLFAGLGAALALGEPVLAVHWVSGGLILGGLLLATKGK